MECGQGYEEDNLVQLPNRTNDNIRGKNQKSKFQNQKMQKSNKKRTKLKSNFLFKNRTNIQFHISIKNKIQFLV